MSRNVESHFAFNPTRIDTQRSTFERNYNVKSSWNVGELVPFYLDEVLPGDTHKIKTNKVVRLSTLVAPIMDNLFLDTYYFFVPHRLVWEHWKEFNGENTNGPWTQTIDYEIPQVTAPSGGWNVGSLADYFGVPTGVDGISVNALPFRSYALIVNDWFRDENLLDPANWSKSDATIAGSNGSNYITDIVKGGKPFHAAKYHDYFTSCLPAPQKGPDVMVPLGKDAPVYSFYGRSIPFSNMPKDSFGNAVPPHAIYATGNAIEGPLGAMFDSSGYLEADNGSTSSPYGGAVFNNLFADLSAATSSSINQLRMAFQIQKLYEQQARSGSRYIEILKGMFGVTSPDARLQRPEYLGGSRVPITINQTIQQSETNITPQGNTAAYSLTVDHNSDFVKSFTEHGFIIGLAVVRYKHSYQQGLEKLWTRKSKFDFYWPVLANIGEQAVKLREIYCDGSSADDTVFGYQEAWAEYRYKPDKVTGEMRSSYATSLDVWHLGDDYSSAPVLSASWIQEDKNVVDRVLAVSSSVSNQIIADIFVENTTTRPMPLYSIPGLIDHH